MPRGEKCWRPSLPPCRKDRPPDALAARCDSRVYRNGSVCAEMTATADERWSAMTMMTRNVSRVRSMFSAAQGVGFDRIDGGGFSPVAKNSCPALTDALLLPFPVFNSLQL